LANPLKGEIDFTVGDKTYVLCFPSNSLVEVEEVSGKDIVSVLTEWQQSPAVAPLRTLLWGALRKHQPAISLFDAGDLVDEIGAARMEELGSAIGKALRFRLSGAFEDAKPAENA
jgi:hypothetical protein